MATYLLISLVFAVAVTTLGRFYIIKKWQAALFAGICVAILTLHFEPIMIQLGLYEHDSSKIIGILIRDAIPIEDFLYVAFAAVAVPSLWDRFSAKNTAQATVSLEK